MQADNNINVTKKTKRSNFHSKVSSDYHQAGAATKGRVSNLPRLRKYRTIEDYVHALADSMY